MTTVTAAEFAAKLNAKQTGPGQWMACCPAHNDTHPSLSITDKNGTMLLNDFGAGCTFEAILQAAGYGGGGTKRPQKAGMSQPQSAAGQRFPGDENSGKSERKFEWSDLGGWPKATKYDYTDEAGKQLYQKGRIDFLDSKGLPDKKCNYRHAEGRNWVAGLGELRRVPYRLQKVRRRQ
jgi:hypothetical protein